MYRINTQSYDNSRAFIIRQFLNLVVDKYFFEACVTTIAFLMLTPLMTHGIKNKLPGIQNNIKLFCYLSSAAVAFVGYTYENSPKTLSKRRFQDANVNANYVQVLNDTRTNLQIKALGEEIQAQHKINEAQTKATYYLPANTSQNSPVDVGEIKFPSALSYDQSQYALPEVEAICESEYGEDFIKYAYDFIVNGTGMANQHFLLYGGSGDCKTSFLHYLLHRWLLSDPTLIPYICDRKFLGFDKKSENFRSNWGGLPVYDDIEKLLPDGVVSPSIYMETVPRLNVWLKPVYDLIQRRNGFNEPETDPHWDPIAKRYKKILVIIDDATANLTNLSEDESRGGSRAAGEAKRYIKEIVTMGRSVGIMLFIIAHNNADKDLQIGTAALSNMNPLMGSSFADNAQVAMQNKREIIPEGIQAIRSDMKLKAKGFATAWPECPYIPPAKINTGLAELINTELVCLWHKHAYEGFIIHDRIPWQKTSFKKHGFDISDRDNSPIQPANDQLVKTKKKSAKEKTGYAALDNEIVIEPSTIAVLNNEVLDPWSTPESIDACSDDVLITDGLRQIYLTGKRNHKEGLQGEPTKEYMQDLYLKMSSESRKTTDAEARIEFEKVVWPAIQLSDDDYNNLFYGDSQNLNDPLIG